MHLYFQKTIPHVSYYTSPYDYSIDTLFLLGSLATQLKGKQCIAKNPSDVMGSSMNN